MITLDYVLREGTSLILKLVRKQKSGKTRFDDVWYDPHTHTLSNCRLGKLPHTHTLSSYPLPRFECTLSTSRRGMSDTHGTVLSGVAVAGEPASDTKLPNDLERTRQRQLSACARKAFFQAITPTGATASTSQNKGLKLSDAGLEGMKISARTSEVAIAPPQPIGAWAESIILTDHSADNSTPFSDGIRNARKVITDEDPIRNVPTPEPVNASHTKLPDDLERTQQRQLSARGRKAFFQAIAPTGATATPGGTATTPGGTALRHSSDGFFGAAASGASDALRRSADRFSSRRANHIDSSFDSTMRANLGGIAKAGGPAAPTCPSHAAPTRPSQDAMRWLRRGRIFDDDGSDTDDDDAERTRAAVAAMVSSGGESMVAKWRVVAEARREVLNDDASDADYDGSERARAAVSGGGEKLVLPSMVANARLLLVAAVSGGGEKLEEALASDSDDDDDAEIDPRERHLKRKVRSKETERRRGGRGARSRRSQALRAARDAAAARRPWRCARALSPPPTKREVSRAERAPSHAPPLAPLLAFSLFCSSSARARRLLSLSRSLALSLSLSRSLQELLHAARAADREGQSNVAAKLRARRARLEGVPPLERGCARRRRRHRRHRRGPVLSFRSARPVRAWRPLELGRVCVSAGLRLTG